MNEQIKECWLRAAREDSGDKWDTQEEFIERFARLIVQECIEVCGSVAAVKAGYNDAAVADTAYLCGDQIKEHFGVD